MIISGVAPFSTIAEYVILVTVSVTGFFWDNFPQYSPTGNWLILEFWAKFLEFFVELEILEFFLKILEFFSKTLEFYNRVVVLAGTLRFIPVF